MKHTIYKLKMFLKQLFCNHNYVKISWYQEEDKHRNERYAVRIYGCNRCGKQIKVDGRYDPYF